MAKTYIDFDLPNDIRTIPLALIGVVGLDTLNNAVHRNIWDSLVNIRQADRSAVVFKNLPINHQFPPMKNKRNSYEWYMPKGILKRNWMQKHLNQLPAVIVIFYDLDWDDSQWSEKKSDCASRVQSIKALMEGRLFRVVLVLIQQSSPLPAGEDPQSAEKASMLCSACEVTPKSLLILPVSDHLQGYILRLEKAFYELALSYYQHEIKHVKSHKDHLNKTTHQYLFVRHAFKMGFFYEMKQDSLAARVQYLHAYNSLLEVRTSETNLHEVKTVAAFLIYKICRLFFIMNDAREALLHFTLHIDKFKLRTGPRDLIFEHHAWLSKQYNLFGDLFDEMVKQGLTAGQTQHPGIYYEQAARHSTNRKLSVQEIQSDLLSYPENDPLEGWQNLEFYGQRPWRPAKLSAEPPDLAREKEAVMALQYREKFIVDHSSIIINLLSKAITQFKTHRCPRMRRQLVVQMADEYFNSRNFGKALTLMNLMLADYQSEKWWGLYVCLLARALTCAYLTACIQEYIELSLGALSKFERSQHIRIFDNLVAILELRTPNPEPGVSEADLVGANEMWQATNKASQLRAVSVAVSPLISCIQVKAVLQKAACDIVEIKVYIKCDLPKILKFSELSVCVYSASQSLDVCVNNSGEDPAQFLAFQPGQVKCYLCSFIPSISDINTSILIRSVSLKLGLPSENERQIELCFTGAGPDLSFCEAEFQYLRPNVPNDLNFDWIAPILSAVISPRKSKLTISLNCEAPALLAEWFEIVVNIKNTEEVDISNVILEVSSLSSTEFGSEHWLEICCAMSNEPSSFPLVMPVSNIKKGGEEKCAFYIASHTLSCKELLVKVKYEVHVSDVGPQICIQESPLKIEVCKAFDVTTVFLDVKFENLSKIYAKEPFNLQLQIDCISPWPVIIESTSVELSKHVAGNHENILKNIELVKGEAGSEIVSLNIDEEYESPVPLGTYIIEWRRASSKRFTKKLVSHLPQVKAEMIPLYAEMLLPAVAWMHTPLAVTYLLHNNSSDLLDLQLTMEPSVSFAFSGQKTLTLKVLPESYSRLDYNFFPLYSGLITLPKLRVIYRNTSLNPQAILEMLDRNLPTNIYVLPQSKSQTLEIDAINPKQIQ